jgi:hypothetical protein
MVDQDEATWLQVKIFTINTLPVTAQPPRRKPCRARCIDLLDVTTAGLIQDWDEAASRSFDPLE